MTAATERWLRSCPGPGASILDAARARFPGTLFEVGPEDQGSGRVALYWVDGPTHASLRAAVPELVVSCSSRSAGRVRFWDEDFLTLERSVSFEALALLAAPRLDPFLDFPAAPPSGNDLWTFADTFDRDPPELVTALAWLSATDLPDLSVLPGDASVRARAEVAAGLARDAGASSPLLLECWLRLGGWALAASLVPTGASGG